MNNRVTRQSLRTRLRWWLYDRCIAYCVRCIHPDADPSEFSFLDNANFVAISKDELNELIEEAPMIAWRFGVLVST